MKSNYRYIIFKKCSHLGLNSRDGTKITPSHTVGPSKRSYSVKIYQADGDNLIIGQ